MIYEIEKKKWPCYKHGLDERRAKILCEIEMNAATSRKKICKVLSGPVICIA